LAGENIEKVLFEGDMYLKLEGFILGYHCPL
jgi:hypothetical protein